MCIYSFISYSLAVIIGATVIGLIGAITGVASFKFLIKRNIIHPKTVIVINAVIILLLMVFVLYIQNSGQLLVAAFIAGAQVGPVGALSRSILSSMIPAQKQTRLFSLYQFSQEATSWIGSLVIAAIATDYGGGDNVYLKSVVFTCMVQIGIGIPCLLIMNYDRGVAQRQRQEKILARKVRESFHNLKVNLRNSSSSRVARKISVDMH